jgi:multiple antibiotic resistance protein
MGPIAKSTFLLLSALFPIVNPLGSAPLFLSLTRYYSTDQRKILSRRIAMNSIVLIVASYFIGRYILDFFGISLPVVQVGGGLVLVSTGWSMLNKSDDEDETKAGVHRTVDTHDLFQKAFYPLTLPLTVGPGSISVAITLGANDPHSEGALVFSMVGAVLGAILIAISVYFCYAFADRVAQVIGATSMSVIMRLSSFLIVCIGTQIIWNGVEALLTKVLHPIVH